MSPTEVNRKEMNVIRSLLVWLCFIPVAILNGGLRQYVLVRWFGEVGANALSGVLLSLFILLITWLLLPRIVRYNQKESYRIGIVWMLLTIGFEFIFGLTGGISFRELLSAYNPMSGNLWLLVVITTFGAPRLVCDKERR